MPVAVAMFDFDMGEVGTFGALKLFLLDIRASCDG